jgi:hypothetical protein
MTLAQWQVFTTGKDLNSHKSPIAISNENELSFEYNDTKVIKTVLISQPMIDVMGTKYSTSITLQPFSSVVLIKDNGTLKNAEIVSIDEVTRLENQADQMKFDIFPNPSAGSFTVRFSQIPNAGCRIEVLDISGRKIVARMVTETSESFELNGCAPGIYFVKSTLNSTELIEKLIVK